MAGKYNNWTNEEIKFLQDNWRKLSDKEIGEILKRPISGVGYKRNDLGLNRQQKLKWQDWEKEYLNNAYYDTPHEEMCKILNRNWSTIKETARLLGLKRKGNKFLSKDKKFKTCKGCNKTFPNTEKYFYKQENRLRSYCIECWLLISENKQRKNGVITSRMKKEMFKEGYKYCGKCKQWKEIDDFYLININKFDKWQDLHHWCIDCEKKYGAIYYTSHLFIDDNWEKDEIISLMKCIVEDISYEKIAKNFKRKIQLKEKINVIKNYFKSETQGNKHFASDGSVCLSNTELIITEWLIGNGFRFKKEYPYKKLTKNLKDKRLFDWMIEINNKKYYVEYFGLYDGRKNISGYIYKYFIKMKKKIKDLYKLGKHGDCIFIFPYDIKNKSLEEIFNVLFITQLKENKNIS